MYVSHVIYISLIAATADAAAATYSHTHSNMNRKYLGQGVGSRVEKYVQNRKKSI